MLNKTLREVCLPVGKLSCVEIDETHVTGQETTDHANIRLEHGHDKVTIEMRGCDHILNGLFELIDATEERERVETVDERERVVAQDLVDVPTKRVLVSVATFAAQRHELVRWIRVCHVAVECVVEHLENFVSERRFLF